MIKKAENKYSTFDYDEDELARIRQEFLKKHGKDYCVFPTAEVVHMIAMAFVESRAAKKGFIAQKKLLLALDFVGAAMTGGLIGAGFVKEETTQIVKEILEKIKHD